jgi:hypothetical protein
MAVFNKKHVRVMVTSPGRPLRSLGEFLIAVSEHRDARTKLVPSRSEETNRPRADLGPNRHDAEGVDERLLLLVPRCPDPAKLPGDGSVRNALD